MMRRAEAQKPSSGSTFASFFGRHPMSFPSPHYEVLESFVHLLLIEVGFLKEPNAISFGPNPIQRR